MTDQQLGPVPAADNDYFVAWEDGALSQSLEPWRGKHAVTTAQFFDRVREQQAAAMPASWYYRPLKVEVEITNQCDQSCPHCGMSPGTGPDLPEPILMQLPEALHHLGIPGLSITGGEPFTAAPRLFALLDRCRDRVDVVKISTNASWASTLERARTQLRELRWRGLAAASLFRPVMLASFLKPRGCFRQTIGAVVVPTPLIRSTGQVYSCSVFGMPNTLALGNLLERGLHEILAKANSDPLIRTLAQGSLPLMADGLPREALENTFADNFHEACWRLVELRDGSRR